MAKFELLPDLTVMGIQGAIFGAAYFVVKTQFVQPYLKLRDKRDALTTGNQSDAKASLEECSTKMNTIESRINQVLTDSKMYRDAQKLTATKKQSEILEEATKEAKSSIESMTNSIAAMLKEERTKIPEIVKSLNEELYKKTLN